ncbi:unnamed protein product [Penicillium salamii]|uniref:Mpv17/PMP22 n=1 Tax=Penicillium salamii TaxID=1612424 RepID=A0A9W4JCN0_9EURO|nr:unnamed protein product [Penicillium salamii]CAG7984600.1 unnamed protein product [Penicillium salamii]CAG8055398.1 unnamed protein product [Penicillium salamii]CAG8079340.1 unnamed protein product [Penicillium salamii]CAG8087207.1 unnamed protein product [Penicillium salamii]
MRFLHIGPISRAPTQTPRPINPRSLLRRPQPRHNSHSAGNGPKNQRQVEQSPSKNAETPTQPPAGALVRSRGLRNVIMAGPVGKFGRWYARAQERKPYATQLWSSIIIYLCGDLSAQLMFPAEVPVSGKEGAEEIEGEQETVTAGYDPYRTLRHLCVGVGSSIPSYKWFAFLSNNFNYSSKILSILTKVVVQQTFFTPVFNTYFFSVHSLLAGATLDETWERLKKALPVSIQNSVKLWPAVTAFSFMYVPAQFRNVFSGCIAVGWQTYLSWLNQKAAKEVLAAEQLAAAEERNQGALHTVSTGKLVTAAA